MTDILDGLILLPHLQIENANGISGPLTWGFPPPSAFTGFVHALHRRMGNEKIRLDGVGIVCHRFDPQVYKPEGKYEYRFKLARNPVGQDGKPQGIVEEGRVHLEVSLLIGVYGEFEEEREGENFARRLYHEALSMRLAGGSLRPDPASKRHTPTYMEMSGTWTGEEQAFRKWRRRLLPGFALVSRRDLLRERLAELRQQEPMTNALEALLDLTCINIEPIVDDAEEPEKATWHTSRSRPGWLVPLPVGYRAISPLYEPGEVKNTRDDSTPFRFVECLYSLGEWLSPHRLTHPQEMLWYHEADPDTGLYLCEHHRTSS
jgi:CRISPR-associated protein Csy2